MSESPQPQPMDEGKLYAILAYVLNIVGFILVLVAKKDNKFAMFHAKQSLVLSIGWIIAWVFIGVIPLIGPFVGGLLLVALFVLWIMGIINAASGAEKNLPVIGDLAAKINI
jgi:uncharacterized membrane protein